MELLSSGQKIRVRLLCEILYKPDLIIIDEAFSSLDRKTLVSSFGAIDKKTALLVIDHSNDFKYLFNQNIVFFQFLEVAVSSLSIIKSVFFEI